MAAGADLGAVGFWIAFVCWIPVFYFGTSPRRNRELAVALYNGQPDAARRVPYSFRQLIGRHWHRRGRKRL